MNLPIDFIFRTKALLKDESDKFLSALDSNPPTSIRLNTKKYINRNENKKSTSVPWASNGYYLKSRPQFTFDPLLHAGCYYVQEASSMFIEQALIQYAEKNWKILDLCAAPGGKSTLIADYINEDGLLVSNELIRSRANILAENIVKWGNPNVIVTNNKPSDIGQLKSFFDLILVDAPCSGEGMFRKDEEAISEWSVNNVEVCRKRQQQIVKDIWNALKPGGLLLYSTCTYNTEENEENVLWIKDNLGAEILSLKTEAEWGIQHSFIEDISAYHFFPHKIKGEGFFLAVLRKISENYDPYPKPNKKKMDKGIKQSNKEILDDKYKNCLIKPGSFTYYKTNNHWLALKSQFENNYNTIDTMLNIIPSGVNLGEFKGKDFIPSHTLALSNCLNSNAFETYEVDWATAISYLKRETISLPTDFSLGYVIITYKGYPLGFVKNIGDRINNLYPQEWRIRSSYLPEQEIIVLDDAKF